jgi:hypothetical protein
VNEISIGEWTAASCTDSTAFAHDSAIAILRSSSFSSSRPAARPNDVIASRAIAT